jgi:beta-aspartyl-peptidase (threonine type)
MNPERKWQRPVAGPAIVIHGGAGKAEPQYRAGRIEGCKRAALAASALLRQGLTALDAVEKAGALLEDDPLFNAGLGGALTEAGTLECDASIMEGLRLEAGAVCSLRSFSNPIRIARAVLQDGRHVMLSAEGAALFARERGFEPVDEALLITEHARERLARFIALRDQGAKIDAGNTVGAVALDQNGTVAAATSTGGRSGKLPGRVGDSPIIGAGTYADNRSGAVSATGDGEGIWRLLLAYRITERVRSGWSLPEALADGLDDLEESLAMTGGLIAINHATLCLAFNTPNMAWAAADVHGLLGAGD